MTKNDDTPPSGDDLTPTTLFQGLDLEDDVDDLVGESLRVTFAPQTANVLAQDRGVSATGGRLFMTDEPVDHGVNVAHVIDPSRLCMGYIGNSKTKFCIQAKGECTVQSHRGRPFSDAQPGLYCFQNGSSGVNASVCLTAPFVKRELLKESEYQDLMIESKDLETLQEQFAIASMRSEIEIDESSMGSADDAADLLLSKVNDYKTPKKEKSSDQTASLEGGRTFDGAVKGFWEKVKGFENTVGPKKLEVDYIQEQAPKWSYEISQVKDYLGEQGRLLASFAHTVNERLTLVDGLVHKVKTMEVKIGSQNELLRRHGTEPVLWNAIAGLVDSGTSLMLDQERMKKVVDATSDTSVRMQSELQVILKSFKSKMDSTTECVKTLRQSVTELKAGTAKGTAKGVDAVESTKARSSLLGLSFLDVADETKATPRSESGTSSTAVAHGRDESPTAKFNDVDFDDTVRLVEELVSRVGILESFKQDQDEKMLEEAVKLMDVIFTCKDDVEDWYCSHGFETDGVPPCGLFIDPLIALYWIGTKIDGAGASRTKLEDLLTGKKLGMSELAMGAYESFNSDIPIVFRGESKEKTVITDEDKSKLTNLPSFKAWHHPGRDKGLSQQIQKASTLVKKALHNAIRDNFSKYDKLYTMALEMLESSFDFVSQLCNYITNTYIDFMALDVGSDKDVWNLITFVVERLFKDDFAKARQLSVTRLNAGDRDSAFVVMWCSFRSVAVAKSLCSLGIGDSPPVSASYVRFVLTQSNRGKLVAVEEENQKLRKELDDLKADVAAIKSQAKEAKRTADSAMSKVTKKQRVDDKKA